MLLPDWKGNERLDSLRNIVRDGRVSVLFLIPGSNTTIRVNGLAKLSPDQSLCGQFERLGKRPRTVIAIRASEIYSQCARALIRSGLWTSGDASAGLPSIGDMLKEITDGSFDGATYDAEWPRRAARTMW